jgi:hypothetical protein
MYMKKYFRFALMALLMGGLALSVSSCKDDDDSETNKEGSDDNTEAAADESRDAAQRFWSVASQLVGPFEVTDDYASKTFQPTIGQADGNSTVRVVNTGSMAAAAQRFASLTGADVNEETTSYTFEDDAVGRLVYTKTNDGTSLATVDVSIKQIPDLQRIVFKTEQQMGDNGKFAGTPYYSFGDVVLAYSEYNKPEYWICVRPALGMAGKEDTHWVSVSPLPQKNIYHYSGKKKQIDFNMPKYLNSNYEQMQNLAELLYAMFNGEQWEKNTDEYSTESMLGYASGLPIFGDLLYTRVKYFNRFFWQTVNRYWEKNDLFHLVFGYSIDEMRQIVNGDGGLHMVYDSKWSTSVSDSPSIYEYVFKNGDRVKSNMHDYKKKTTTKDVMSGQGIKVDCVSQYQDSHWVLPEFFGDDQPRFIVRSATGRELLGTKPSVYASIQGGKLQITDFYVYNDQRKIAPGPQTEPEVLEGMMGDVVNDRTLQNLTHYRGAPHYHFGDIYQDEQGHKWMVLTLAGLHYKDVDQNVGDSACYSELISLDGLTPSADKGQITNLPTRDQVIRAAPIIWYYFCFTATDKFRTDQMADMNLKSLGNTILGQVEHCKFDIRMLFQMVRAQQEVYWSRESSHLLSIAYRDPADQSGKQRLLRVVKNSQNERKDPHIYFSEHYPEKPDSTSEFYDKYSKDPIYLQDIAFDDMVTLFREDSYARQPIYENDSWPRSTQQATYRQPRAESDPKAKDVTNYYYDQAKWRQRTFPTDMWNEPVFMFRMTAVYDRGDMEYATVTVDGHTLRPLWVRKWDENNSHEEFKTNTYSIWMAGARPDLQSFWLDGKLIQWPDPIQAWR